jgi:hypothetical protein
LAWNFDSVVFQYESPIGSGTWLNTPATIVPELGDVQKVRGRLRVTESIPTGQPLPTCNLLLQHSIDSSPWSTFIFSKNVVPFKIGEINSDNATRRQWDYVVTHGLGGKEIRLRCQVEWTDGPYNSAILTMNPLEVSPWTEETSPNVNWNEEETTTAVPWTEETSANVSWTEEETTTAVSWTEEST